VTGWCSLCGVGYDTADAFQVHEAHAHQVPLPWCNFHQTDRCACPYLSGADQFVSYRRVHPRDFFW